MRCSMKNKAKRNKKKTFSIVIFSGFLLLSLAFMMARSNDRLTVLTQSRLCSARTRESTNGESEEEKDEMLVAMASEMSVSATVNAVAWLLNGGALKGNREKQPTRKKRKR